MIVCAYRWIFTHLHARGGDFLSRVLDDEYITVAEAAKALKVSQSTIWRWVNSGELPAHRVGQRGVRLKSTELTRLISPARQGVRKGGVRIELQMERERLSRPMTKEEKEGALAALDAVEQLAKEILARHGLERFTPSSAELLNESREERTRQFS
jgi:excisionase family DNA binding protein